MIPSVGLWWYWAAKLSLRTPTSRRSSNIFAGVFRATSTPTLLADGRRQWGPSRRRRFARTLAPQQCHHPINNIRDSSSTSRKFSTSSTSTSSSISYREQRLQFIQEIAALPETLAARRLEAWLDEQVVRNDDEPATSNNRIAPPPPHPSLVLSDTQLWQTLHVMLATFCLHVESRVAALMGQGYYTIGPCGEEALASVAHCFSDSDSLALHYRHLAIQLGRQVVMRQSHRDNDAVMRHENDDDILPQLLLDRARGYTVSRYDPVTGGVHCSIGSPQPHDHVVTSTLASQCPAAVGRALGRALRSQIQDSSNNNSNNNNNKPPSSSRPSPNHRPISFVTLGDGSVHHAHFWSAYHLARHARHRHYKCPVVFGISDNGLSISYNPQGYLDTLFSEKDPYMPRFTVSNSQDPLNVYRVTQQAIQYARTQAAPVVIVYQNLMRRFGHAATDRQVAYLTPEQIAAMQQCTVLEDAIQQIVLELRRRSDDNVPTTTAALYSQVRERYRELQQQTLAAFAQAASEPKVTRQDMLERVAPPLAPVPLSSSVAVAKNVQESAAEDFLAASISTTHASKDAPTTQAATTMTTPPLPRAARRDVMRKHMTRVLSESMTDNDTVVYLGEDVVHGGYYVVTEGLAKQFPGRVLDFPPDETALLGAALGMAQSGLIPIVEIPYAKYLDCGADMFQEIAILHWLTQRRDHGMVIRLQGFDRGRFGGNFHTSNVLSIPPGVDVCCYSNGEDYVRGFRHALYQAKHGGRVVMSVDCTNLLNLRHLYNTGDRGWERAYPENDEHSMITFDFVRRYGGNGRGERATTAIVTYGNGVVTSLQARQQMVLTGVLSTIDELDVLDCPYLSAAPQGLKDILPQYERVIFADICKQGPSGSVLSNVVCSLQSENLLPDQWQLVAAPRTYNPLGSMCTFLNPEDVVECYHKLNSSAPVNVAAAAAAAPQQDTDPASSSFHNWLAKH